MFETQIMPSVISADMVNDPDTLAMVAASASVAVSDIPFEGPIAAVRVGRVNGEFVANPTNEQIEQSDVEIVISGSRDAVMMVEGESNFLSESEMLDAIFFGHEALQPLITLQEELAELVGKEKREFEAPQVDEELVAKVTELAEPKVIDAVKIQSKQERYAALADIRTEVKEALAGTFEDREDEISAALGSVEKTVVRRMVTKDRIRIDGRDMTTIRPISCEVGVLPRSHGSALFTRGETQALVAATLGTGTDEQRIDNVQGMEFKKFMLHYNFPPFCVGETSMRLFPGRREIGHGFLAERSAAQILPKHEDFPYTIRVVSDILESNGSSSMASVCGASLSLMDAGVPVSEAIAGIAMGLIKEGDDVAVLSDILGDEDHLGDMDFKVTGSAKGITALQMDIKITGVTKEIMIQALDQAREGRIHILGEMAKAIDAPRAELSEHAPQITSIKVKSDQVRTVIGSGGKNIRGIIDATGCAIDIEDDGTIKIASSDGLAAKQAIKMIRDLTQEPEVDKLYMGTVKKLWSSVPLLKFTPVLMVWSMFQSWQKNVSVMLPMFLMKGTRFWSNASVLTVKVKSSCPARQPLVWNCPKRTNIQHFTYHYSV